MHTHTHTTKIKRKVSPYTHIQCGVHNNNLKRLDDAHSKIFPHHRKMYFFSFFAVPGNDKQLRPIFFSRRRYAFFLSLSLFGVFSWKYTQHIQSNESRRVAITPAFNAKKKEIRRIKVNRPGRRKKKMMISHHCFQFWKETSSHFIRYFAIGPRRSIKKINKRNGIRKSTLPPCFSSFVLLLSSLFFLVVSSEKNTVFFLFCFNIFI